MDIVRTRQQHKISKKTLVIIAVVIFIVSISFSIFNVNKGTYVVNRESLLVDGVQRGELNISVRGTGILVPKDIRWISTNVDARVERILTKAGVRVKKGDLLLELSNPRLIQQLEESKWQLEEMEAQIHAELVSAEANLLDQEAMVNNERLNHERALLTLNAMNKLLDQGVAAVSQIDHEEVKIDVAQFKERWQLELKRLDKRKESLVVQRKAHNARINRMHRVIQRFQEQVDGLKVKATMDSIVQAMPMELGQQVNSGTNLARLARRGEFLAELRIPEQQIKDVALGQAVTIDTRTSKIKGLVIRIEPAVINGSVQIDVELIGEIPYEARPDLTVDGVIEVAYLADTLFVKRPMFAASFSESTVYILDSDGESAKQKKVKFGQVSTQYIQVLEGLVANDNIIVSDATSWESHNEIRIN